MRYVLMTIVALMLMGCTMDKGFNLISEAEAEEVPNHPTECFEDTHIWETGVDDGPGDACNFVNDLSCAEGYEIPCDENYQVAFQVPGIADKPFPNLMVMPSMVCDGVIVKYLPDDSVRVRIFRDTIYGGEWVLITARKQICAGSNRCVAYGFAVRYCQ